MNQNLKELLSFIFDVSPHEHGAESLCAFSDTLDAYIDTELDLGAARANVRFPDVKAHLSECHECQEEYDDLKAVVQARREAPFVQPRVEPQFDFSYIATPPPAPIWRVALRRGKQVIELFTELRIMVKEGQAFFDQLPSLLTPEWEVAAIAVRKRVRSGQEGRVPLLSLPSKEHDLSLRLSVTPPESNQKEPTLIVEVASLSSPQSPIRARVTLRDAEYNHLESGSTHKEGHVKFADLTPDRYVVDVKHKGHFLQIPIMLTWQG